MLRNTGKPKSILDSKSMGAIFQKKTKEILKKDQVFKNLSKNVKYLKIF